MTLEDAVSTSRLSALERAAQRNIGPMSELGRQIWHGESKPCVTCGEIVGRTDPACPFCGQDLSAEMLARMQLHAGPWYVHEHVRPFPGVTLERLIRQARRGILTTTTIVRGPTTHHQWRFAAETPGLSKHLGVCWKCQEQVTYNAIYCPSCDIHLDHPAAESAEEICTPQPRAPSELDRLNSAIQEIDGAASPRAGRYRIGGLPVSVLIAVILVISVASLLLAVKLRQRSAPTAPNQSTVASSLDSPARTTNAADTATITTRSE
jgi:hypothetical protein